MQNKFRRFGTMIDCSRNAVMSVETLKKWIDITSDLGYNTLMLYIEDTYQIPEQPYFGHLRGRYSTLELRQIDDYAYTKGVEIIPCIQTLAHLNSIFHWDEYTNSVWDCTDILLAEEEKTYDLIERMLATLAKNLTTNIVNIGMDEAHFLGLGRFLEKNGFKERTKILTDHLNIVSDIAAKYELELMMWGDMFVRLANGGDYYADSFEASKEVRDAIPENVRIIYWDYYSFDKERYVNQIKSHKTIKENIAFAGGLWTWGSPIPQNIFSIKANKSALSACLEQGVEDVFLTMWGDDGAECSLFAALPSLYHAAQVAKGITDESEIKAGFKEKFGISFDDFMLLDLPDTPSKHQGGPRSGDDLRNPEKYMLYSDMFMGKYDNTVSEGDAESYAKCAEKLKKLENNEDFGYLFAKARALCDLLAVKYDLGVRTREAYLNKNKADLESIITDYDRLITLIEKYYAAFKNEWFKENKPHGFDIQDTRLGGLSWRVRSCRERLQAFVNGDIEKIEELEEEVLKLHGFQSPDTPHFETQWYKMISANVISHNVF